MIGHGVKGLGMGQVDLQGPASAFNGDVGELVQRAGAQLRRQQSEIGSKPEEGRSFNSIIHRISETSVMEIESLIGDLHRFRDYLLNESRRVQREITEHVQMSQAAAKSTKMIAESLARLKVMAGPNRGPRS
jgi:hypothetical protein